MRAGDDMRSLVGFLIDFVLLLFAIVVALLLRENFELTVTCLIDAIPYFAATATVAVFVLPVSGINRSIWRMSTLPNYVRIVLAITVIVVAAVAMTFAFNRMDGVARSLPILHGILAISLLVGARVLMRMCYIARQTRKAAMAPMKIVTDELIETILVVGISRLAETYLQSIAELARNRFKVVGILGRSRRHVGRLVGTTKVLGLPEQIETVVSDLELHGVFVDRIVVACSFDSLSENAQTSLLAIEQSGSIELHFLAERLGLEKGSHDERASAKVCDEIKSRLSFQISPDDINTFGQRHYWKLKRFGDFFSAAVLIVLLAPVMLTIGLFVSMTIGLPVTFWQQRPGIGGRLFRLYKFRTMAGAYTPEGRILSDDARVSTFGNFLRRTRLDELPQLFNIVLGDMSFIGPRPLLPRDQAESYRARLLVRPGLTGWAQVVGGRIISKEDKAVLDVWYVQNASLALDIEILLRTVPMVLFGEQAFKPLIKRAWTDLNVIGVLREDLSHEATKLMYPAE